MIAPEREDRQRSMYRELLKALDEARLWLDRSTAEGTDEHAAGSAAFHLGIAGGIAFSGRMPGIERLALFEEISDAAEERDLGRVDRVRLATRARLRSKSSSDQRASAEGSLDWAAGFLQMLATLNEARRAWSEGDEFRRPLMLGFLAGLMHWEPGLRYKGGSLRDAVVAIQSRDQESASLWVEAESISPVERQGESADMDSRVILLRWVGDRLAAGHRLTGPLFMHPADESEEERRTREAHERAHFEREETSIQRAQTFGRRISGGDEPRISVPTSYAVNRALVLQHHQGEGPADEGG